jgi:ADP-heptose:LPS heptosyltransferase
MPKFGSSTPADLRVFRPGRVCVIKPSALGDVVNAFPCLNALRTLWPEASFTWVINKNLQALVEGHPQLNGLIAYDRTRAGLSPKGLRGFRRFLGELRGSQFDLTIDLQGLLRSGVMTAATGAPGRVGLSDAREGAVWFYTHRVKPPGGLDQAHAVDRLLSIASAFGADISRPSAVLAVSDADRAWARNALAGVRRPRLGLNLGARWETKRWPPAHFAEVAKRAVEIRGAGLFTVGAPEDRPLVEELARRLSPIRVADFCGATTLPQLAALAEEADVLLSNDTGPLHLAAAAGARVVGVYTCTSTALNGPFGRHVSSVQSGVWCAGSYHVNCPRRLECMVDLDPDRVWPFVLQQLDGATGAARNRFGPARKPGEPSEVVRF